LSRGTRRAADFPDGGDKTILVAEAADPVEWTKPEELPFGPDAPLPTIGNSRYRFCVAVVDGRVLRISKDVNEAFLAITRNGSDDMGPDF
jgi:hypothetical protein